MDNIHRREPTNKEFKTNFQGLAATKTKKGHLNDQERKKDDKQSTEGVLKRILISKIDTNGWDVVVGKGSDTHTYHCVNPLGSLLIPDSTISTNKLYYIPKNKTAVDIDIDKKSHIYTITRVKGQQIPLASFNDKLYLSVDTNSKTNSDINAEITMSKDDITLQGDNIVVKDNDDNEVNLIDAHNEQVENIEGLRKLGDDLSHNIEENARVAAENSQALYNISQKNARNITNLQQANQSLEQANQSLLSRIQILEETVEELKPNEEETQTGT